MKTLVLMPFPFNSYFKLTSKYFYSFLELMDDDFYFFSDRGFQYMHNKVDFPDNVTYLPNEGSFLKRNWTSKQDEITELHETHGFDRIFVFKNPMAIVYNRGKEKNVQKWLDNLDGKGDAWKTVNVVDNMFNALLPALQLSDVYGLPIYHFVNDPDEFDYRALGLPGKRLFFYKSIKNDAEYFPNYEYHLFNKTRQIDPLKKPLDFSFGFTVYTPDRVPMYESFEKNGFLEEGHPYQVFVKNKFTGFDNLLPALEYDDRIRESKFTMIYPSYNTEYFSAIRFLEAIANACVPIIHTGCVVNEAYFAYKQIFDIIQQNGLLLDCEDSSKIKQALKKDSVAIIEEIRACDDYKRLTSVDWYKERIAETLNGWKKSEGQNPEDVRNVFRAEGARAV